MTRASPASTTLNHNIFGFSARDSFAFRRGQLCPLSGAERTWRFAPHMSPAGSHCKL